MSEPIIRVAGLSKKYLLRHQQQERYTALRDVIAHRVGSLKRGLHRSGKTGVAAPPAREEFWALRDVSFEVARGERLGIIGRNGAGKSTLLKILSRITEPTRGRIELEGRVASLLEVGTGFHPELTGRENIFLNGAILGMGRGEIRRKFDEIVAFAEVEKFLDTPVKRYSSGMYVRLAFAVAAHLEPEILLVDEVLAVGDAEFQKKCLGRMETVGREGRTVLFVSHNMNAISLLCSRALVLADGALAFDGEVPEAVRRYLKFGTTAEYKRRAGADSGHPVILGAWFEDEGGARVGRVVAGEPLDLVVEASNPGGKPLELSLSFWDHLRRPLWNFTHEMHGIAPVPGHGRVRIKVSFTPPRLTVPEIAADLAIGPQGGYPYHDHVIGALSCAIAEPPGGRLYKRYPDWPIHCDALLTWADAEGGAL